MDRSSKEYLAAEHIGKKETTNCTILYPECALNLIDLFTKWMWTYLLYVKEYNKNSFKKLIYSTSNSSPRVVDSYL